MEGNKHFCSKRQKKDYPTEYMCMPEISKENKNASSDLHKRCQEISAMNMPSSRDHQYNKLQQLSHGHGHCLSSYNKYVSDRVFSMDATCRIADDVRLIKLRTTIFPGLIFN